MTNDELLFAMSNMMDEKFKSELRPIKNDIQDMKDDIQDMKDDIQDMKCKITIIESDLAGVKDEIHMVKLCQENMILPRLNTIESCYTDTYHRYKDNADKMESTYSDVELLKRVVSEHSERLQKLA
ncbi:MAG: hypothetical protein NC307_10230 [Roseburia sp.]|nr:hypothetical protein [Roseburia sp.]